MDKILQILLTHLEMELHVESSELVIERVTGSGERKSIKIKFLAITYPNCIVLRTTRFSASELRKVLSEN